MDLFSISQLAQFSGVKQHTIRIWEKRYNAFRPTRSEGNTRYYSNDQLRRLLNIVSLMKLNYKISQLGSMPDSELHKIIEETSYSDLPVEVEYYILHLTRAGLSYDELQFDKIFSHCLLRYGMIETYKKVLYPMLTRIGLMWSCNTMPPANEHFITNLFRQKILTAIDALPHAKPGSETWLLFLPEDEFHEIGLLFAHYLIRLSGKKSIYLGPNVPFDSLKAAVKDAQPQRLLSLLVHRNSIKKLKEFFIKLQKVSIGRDVYVAAEESLMQQIKLPKKIKRLHSANELQNIL